MKFTWLSNAPWAPTGYGNQTKLFVPRLKAAGHDPAIIAFYGLDGGIIHSDGIPIFPKGREGYGQDVAAFYTKFFGAKVLISLIDAWVYNPQLMQQDGIFWVPWFPVDMEPIPPQVANAVSGAYRRFVYSKFAVEQVQNAGMNCTYIPHGVDTKIFKVIDRHQASTRLGLPDDRFIVSMVAANKGFPCRKSFFEQIQAFANLKKKHQDAYLYLHTQMGIMGNNSLEVNLQEYLNTTGLVAKRDYMFANPMQLMMGYPEEAMVDIYNASDVLMNVSMGEGFGIPIVEAQACGCPVIVGDWTSMGEICFSGWKVAKKDSTPTWTLLGSYQYTPHIGAIEDALEQAYRMKGNQDYRNRARDGALQYDADKVAEEYWIPEMAKLEEAVSAWS